MHRLSNCFRSRIAPFQTADLVSAVVCFIHKCKKKIKKSYIIISSMENITLLKNHTILTRDKLVELYTKRGLSVSKIAKLYSCSENKVSYWFTKYGIVKRSISEAVYMHKNPNGDPFLFQGPKNTDEAILFGLGLGLYWGEGLKKGSGGVRLTNSDIRLVSKFILFLERFYSIDKARLRFSLQIFDGVTSNDALNYWMSGLKVSKSQFYKVIKSKVRGKGTYKEKSKYGVLILYFNNIKLKRSILELIEKN